MQALFHIPTIQNCLDSHNSANCSNKQCVTCKFVDLFRATQNSTTPCNPYTLYEALKTTNKRLFRLLNGKHQDSHEFLILLSEVLEQQTHSSHWFTGNFTADLTTHVNCSSCGTVHQSFSQVADFALHLPGNHSIQNALDSYFGYDEIDYFCESCRILNKLQKKHFLISAPKCLILQLKRFSDRSQKNSDEIEITMELNLSHHFLLPQEVAWKYKLVAVTNHFGNALHVGHFNTVVSTYNNTFYEFDDRSVREVSSNLVSETSAYILFYELIQVCNHACVLCCNINIYLLTSLETTSKSFRKIIMFRMDRFRLVV